MSQPQANDLIRETSPYLLQHAYNPVDWKPWKPEILDRARKEGKLLVISIGYAACHWCHVMEKESFEDPETAVVMNGDFISIKVDREERPDVDQVYMNAVQLMTGQGGWPLNIVALPDGRPVWGGTYFPKARWIASLQHIQKLYEKQPEKLREYADNMEKGLQSLETVIPDTNRPLFSAKQVQHSVNRWKDHLDRSYGGPRQAPKFMMPSNFLFLLHYAFQYEDTEIMEYINLSLTKIAYGGVYDHVGGGFSRYSVDAKWHVPHFEKMLYDNGQLVSLYANAYAVTGKALYRNVVYETLTFIERELMHDEGAFYSSLDADSQNEKGIQEEGAFYVWKKDELQQLLKHDFPCFRDYYNINSYGLWEGQNYVLIRKDHEKEVAEKHGITTAALSEKIVMWKSLLLEKREERPRPRLDDKILTSWNALMLKGYVDAYKTFGEPSFLDTALKNARFITEKQLRPDGGLNRNYKNGKSNINAYLEDYAAVTDAFLALHEVTLDEHWLITARNLTDYTFEHFYDCTSHMFFFTSNEDKSLVTRSIERSDNVIPASNSVMAKNLFVLAHHFDDKKYAETAEQMLHNMIPGTKEHPSFHSNWLDLMLRYTHQYHEVAISGKDALKKAKKINRYFLPNKLITGATGASSLPLLQNRFVDNKTLIYVCVDFSCKLPVEKVSDALPQLKDDR
ncbi:thioredoxin domain-containing protein [Sinomicrobium weinanense]|uniref:Thioredoxin domain-containing protein n=1 Tax=Sinomicrobium weinanense TaxID=2842200 RepID=A0A926Q559_9FLAO|nr:thioredoxin domain-containing protein [Sinomicrobium weinanense]MBC9797801.1 thioredoxin domain-containing protein [Sinomicrobium weinanense]MBU3124885.1 thioredoxin domain-containing protein [Sinomicrobium weinanense]